MVSWTALSVIACLLNNALVYSQTSSVGFDPLNDFCRRFAHQTTVIDRRLYIDGGYVDYGGAVYPNTVNYTNTYLLYLDLDDLEWSFPIEHASLSKPSNVPSVVGGILWPDTVNKYIYLYGGEYNWTTPPPSQFTLWYYDVLEDKWEAKNADSSIASASFGAGLVVQDRALAYYYGGWLSNATVLGWNGAPSAQSGFITYDIIEDTWRTGTFYDQTPRAEGVMFYIPASDAGMLVYFGGVQRANNGSYVGVPMNQIYLYDIYSQRWYLQPTTGTAPDMRRRFCGGVSWPEDQSSYNIYFFGGLQSPNEQGLGYGDVWILSIPSFTWTQWYPSANQHHSLTCNVIDNSQMIIMGGYWPNSSVIDCDTPAIYGQHNLNLGADDVAHAGWYSYLPNLTTYQVPQTLFSAIGGGPTGGATVTSPAYGWATDDLEVYFGRKYKEVTRTPTRDVSRATAVEPKPSTVSHSNVAAIAGGVVGGVVIIVVAMVLAYCCLRRRYNKRTAQAGRGPSVTQTPPPIPVDSHPNTGRNLSARHCTPRPAQSLQMMGDTLPPPSRSGGYRAHEGASINSSPWTQHSSPHIQPQGADWTPVPAYCMPSQASQQSQHHVQAPQPQRYRPPPPVPQLYWQDEQSASFELPAAQTPIRVDNRSSSRVRQSFSNDISKQ